MTLPDPPLPLPDEDALDLAASAVVDGVATAEELALVAAAPGGLDRVTALRAVADAVGGPVPGQRAEAAEGALAAALAAFDDDTGGAEAGDAGAPPGGPPVAGGATIARLPRRRPAGLNRLAAVAAALILVAAVGGLAASFLRSRDGDAVLMAESNRGGADEGAAAEGVASGATSTGKGSRAAGGQASPGAPSPPTPEPRGLTEALATLPAVDGGDLGSQEDLEALAQRAAAALDGTPDAAVTTGAALPSDVQACVAAAPAAAGQVVGPLRYRAVGRFRGAPAAFLAYSVPSGDRLLLVMSRPGCTVLGSTPF